MDLSKLVQTYVMLEYADGLGISSQSKSTHYLPRGVIKYMDVLRIEI
jgi:hypothetical protein